METGRTNFIQYRRHSKIIQLKLLALITGVTVSMSSCNHYYYAPNSNFTPLFTEKNEVSLNLSGSAGWEHGGGEAQGAYALGKHVAVMASAFSASGEEGSSDYKSSSNSAEDQDSGDGRYYEAGLGYFTALNKNTSYWKSVFEIYGGFGMGNITNNFGFHNFTENSFSKLFVQPSLGYKSRVFDIAFSGKFSLVNIDFRSNKVDQASERSELDAIHFVQEHPKSLMWEPGLMAQLGWMPIKLKVQLTKSLNLTYSDYPQDDFVFALGINARFNVKKQKQTGVK